MDDPLYGQNLASKFGIEQVNSIVRSSENSTIAVSYIDKRVPGPIHANRPQAGVALIVQLADFDGDIYCQGETLFSGYLPAGALIIANLNEEISGYCSTPCKMVILYVGQADNPSPLIRKFHEVQPPALLIKNSDHIAYGLASSLVSSLRPDLGNSPFVDSVVRAFIDHCLSVLKADEPNVENSSFVGALSGNDAIRLSCAYR